MTLADEIRAAEREVIEAAKAFENEGGPKKLTLCFMPSANCWNWRRRMPKAFKEGTPAENLQFFAGDKPLFSFRSHTDWVCHATERFERAGHSSADTICLDRVGRVVWSGKGFRIADEEDTYPVKCYSLRDDKNA